MSVGSLRLLASLVCLAIPLACVVGLAPASGAADDSHDGAEAFSGAPLNSDAARTAIDLTRTRTKLDQVERRMNVVEADLKAAQTSLAIIDSSIEENQLRLATVKGRVRLQAAQTYVHHEAASGALMSIGSVDDLSSADHYASGIVDIDDADLDELTSVAAALATQRDQRVGDVADIEQQRAQLQISHDDLVRLQTQEQTLLDQWGAVPVMGDSWLSAQQLGAWFKSTGAVAHLAPGTTIDDLARLYVIEGRSEHVRGDIAFAQAVVETGSFRVAAGNNFSGIGVCDSCTGGYEFRTPLDGVRAQIQLLRNYADPDSRAATLANVPSPGLYGTDPVKAADTYDHFSLKGKAPLWNLMGNGNWATDPDYARKVIELYAKIVAFVAAHP
jgi:hypothetical protein